MAGPGFPRPMDLQRQLYRQGQLLRSADLGDGLADNAQLLWWHNRALHRAFGVTAGLMATVNGPGTAVTIDPGLAYDAYGRELLLWQPVELALPRTPGDWTLVARVAAVARSSCTPPTACWPDPPSSDDMALELHWLPTSSVRPSEGVPLLRLPAKVAVRFESWEDLSGYGFIHDVERVELQWTSGVMTEQLRDAILQVKSEPAVVAAVDYLYTTSRGGASLTHRFLSRPLARPRVSSGSLNVANRWRPWLFQRNGTQSIPMGVEVEIDMAAGGFTTPPHVVAWGWWPDGARTNSSALRMMLVGWSYVADVTEERCLFRMLTWFLNASVAASDDVLTFVEENRDQLAGELPQWQPALPTTIHWLAVEIEPTAGM